MLTPRHERVLKKLYALFVEEDIIWALTGSTSFAVQGMALVPNDIDIQTTETGAYKINALLKPYEIAPVAFSSTQAIRSHFGRFKVDGVFVEVMGDIQKKNGGVWEETVAIDGLIDLVAYQDILLPCMRLSYESSAYRKLGRFTRANELDAFISSK